MKNKAIKTKLLTVLLALCMALSLVPMTAFATTIELPAGVSREYLYTQTYHTKVEMTANVSVKDAGGSVIETTQVNKSGDFIEGNVSNTAVQTEIQRIDAEINAPFSSKGTLAVENRTKSLEFDHFDGNNLYSFIPASGDTVNFGTDTEAIEQYFAEHPDAVGTFNTFNDLHEYQVYHITYDLIVQESGTTPAAVENVTLDYENISYKAGDTPRAAASVSGGNCAVAYECWTELRQPEGGGQWYETGRRWYSDSDKMAVFPADERIINFEAGNSYQYNVVLAADSGYSFSNDETVVSVGEDEWGTPGSHKKLEIKESGKELHIKRIYTFDLPNAGQPNAITSAAVENVKLDYKHGDAPQPSARRAGVNMDKYDILYESWEKREKTDEFTTETVAYWYSDESWYQAGEERLTAFDKDGQYQYSVRLKAKDGYTFNGISADDITLNGKSLPEDSDVIVLDEGKSCLVTYGTTLRTVRPLESVTLNGVSTEFYVDGDKPRFNGYSGSAFSDVAYEKWEDKDDRSVGINSDESLNGGYSQLIESFKHGKTYAYGVAFNIADLGLEQGYRFDENTKLYLHGKEVTLNPQQVQVTDGGMTIRFTDVFSMTPEAPWQKIDLVEIEGATINFKAGDKPVFSGTVPESSPNVLRQCEFWEGSDGSGVNSYWFWDQNYEKHITAFESGKTYTYGVYVKAAHGYYFTRDTKLKINGKFYNYHLPEGDPELDNPDFMATLWAVTDLTITPKGGSDPHSHSYGTAWKYDGTNHWHECACGDKADTAAHTFKWVTDKEATATEKGSKHEECTVCGYKKAAVEIPATGSGNGSADQPTNPGNTPSPQTGDNSSPALWFAVLCISGGAVIGTMVVSKKKKHNI